MRGLYGAGEGAAFTQVPGLSKMISIALMEGEPPRMDFAHLMAARRWVKA